MLETIFKTAFDNAAVTILSGLFIACFTYLSLELKKVRALLKAVILLLRDRIIRCHYSVTNKGHCSVYERDTIIEFYNEFKVLLAGDIVIKGLINDIENLPVKEDDK